VTGERVERRLAAVLAADVAGYSRLMGRDEEGTLAQLKSLRKALVDPTIAAHRGRIVKTAGDGMLVEFASAVDAARCAVEVQRGMAAQNADVAQETKIEFRIGIHVGDIIIDDDDIFGDGVNIAARLEGIAEPGGVCISDDAQRQIRGKVEVGFDDMGPQNLKNIAELMRAWRVRLDGTAASAAPARLSAETAQPLALPDKPSIAVLPFQNMSGDPEQEYFADGMVEDIITGLSRSKSLFVIARNSTFTYKGKAVDIKQVGRELGVRYVLEGSVRKSGNRVRITGQLIDAATGTHIWADRFDGLLEDVFDLQDKVAESVVGAIPLSLQQAEIERVRRKPTDSLTAYDFYLRSLAIAHEPDKDVHAEASRLCYKAIDLDPRYSSAYGLAAYLFILTRVSNWSPNLEADRMECIRLARATLKYGGDNAIALARAAFALASVGQELDEGISYVDRALVLDPNLSLAWHSSGWLRIYSGEHATALIHIDRAVRLSPLDLEVYGMEGARACAYLHQDRYADSILYAERAIQRQPLWLPAFRYLAAALALSGQIEQARKVVARLLEISPSGPMSRAVNLQPLRRPEDAARMIEGLRLAGLPA
jgi:adenylate cyclase